MLLSCLPKGYVMRFEEILKEIRAEPRMFATRTDAGWVGTGIAITDSCELIFIEFDNDGEENYLDDLDAESLLADDWELGWMNQ